jgi:lactoylglutathione lyase
MPEVALQGLWHFSFTVADIERSIAFYAGLLGLELVHRQEQSNAYTARLVGYEDAHLKVAQFRLPGMPLGVSGHHLELVEYVHPRGTRSEPEIRNPGEGHLAFVVDDLDAAYAALAAQGVRFVSPPNRVASGVNEGGATCYFRDPDDIVLEMVQPPPRRRAASVVSDAAGQRIAQVIRVRPEHADEYRRLHAAVPEPVLAQIADSGIRRYAIYEHDGWLFGVFDYVGDDFDADMRRMGDDPATQRWWDVCKPLQEPLPSRDEGEWWAAMTEIFHFDPDSPRPS